jgi:hypothetical protein
MPENAKNSLYEVVLGPAAIRIVLSLANPAEREALAAALRIELDGGPNVYSEYRFDSHVRAYSDPASCADGAVYTATPLSFTAYTAIHRPLTSEEFRRLQREQGPSDAISGVYVIDVLPAESGFTRTVPRLV